jgi:rod shape-determining protein MreD
MPYFPEPMLILVFMLTGLLLAAVQTTVLMPSPLWPAAPDLYYILVAYAACQFNLYQGILILLPVSFAMDVYSGTVEGLHPAICACGWMLLKFMAVKMPVRRPLYQLPIAAASYLLVSWLAALLLNFIEDNDLAWSWPLMLFRAGLVLLCSYPLFRCFDFLNTKLRGRLSFVKANDEGNQFRQDKTLR